MKLEVTRRDKGRWDSNNATKPGKVKWEKDRHVRGVGPKEVQLIPDEVKVRSSLAGQMLLWGS